ncbi:MAG: hypothetical protein WCE49_14965 [Terrimicrobiaceae bacterium]
MESTPIVAVTSAAPKQRRRWWRWLLVGVLAMAVGGWCARFWLGELLAESLRTELAARGFHVSWSNLKVDSAVTEIQAAGDLNLAAC